MKVPNIISDFGPFSNKVISALNSISDTRKRTRYAYTLQMILCSVDNSETNFIPFNHSCKTIESFVGRTTIRSSEDVFGTGGEVIKTLKQQHSKSNTDDFFNVFSGIIKTAKSNKKKLKKSINPQLALGSIFMPVPNKDTLEEMKNKAGLVNRKRINTNGLTIDWSALSGEDKKFGKMITEDTDKYSQNQYGRWLQIAGSNISKETFYKFDQSLVSIDIRSAQAKLLVPGLCYFNHFSFPTHVRKARLDLLNVERDVRGKGPILFDDLEREMRTYTNLGLSVSDLYSFIAEDINMDDMGEVVCRDFIKQEFDQLLNNVKFQGTTKKICAWFNKNFPSLYEYICDYKFYNTKTVVEEFKLHNKLQCLYGDVFKAAIEKVQRKKETPFLYRYDAVWVLKSDMALWLEEITNSIEKITGLKFNAKDFHIKFNNVTPSAVSLCSPCLSNSKPIILSASNSSLIDLNTFSLPSTMEHQSLSDTSLSDTNDVKSKNDSTQLADEVVRPSITKTRNRKGSITKTAEGLYKIVIKKVPYRSKTIEGLYEKLKAAGINEQFELK